MDYSIAIDGLFFAYFYAIIYTIPNFENRRTYHHPRNARANRNNSSFVPSDFC